MSDLIDCELGKIIDQHGELACLKYTIAKCEKLARSLTCGTKDLLTDAAEAQVGLLLVQLILAEQAGIDCVTDKMEEIAMNLNEDNEAWRNQ